jgi:hypothetical protein
MKRTHVKAFNELKKLGCPVFVHHSAPDYFDISAEDSNSYQWADYYSGDYNEGWIFGTHPTLDAVLRKHGLLAEWVNPAHLRVYEA